MKEGARGSGQESGPVPSRSNEKEGVRRVWKRGKGESLE